MDYHHSHEQQLSSISLFSTPETADFFCVVFHGKVAVVMWSYLDVN